MDDEEELETLPVVNQNNNNYNIFSDSESESNDEEAKEIFFDDDIDKEVEDQC